MKDRTVHSSTRDWMRFLAWIGTFFYFSASVTLRAVALLLPFGGMFTRSTQGSNRRATRVLESRGTELREEKPMEGTDAAADTSRNAVVSSGTSPGPTHLVVLVHGLGGTPEDLSYLKEALERNGGPGTLVHLARCNKNKTRDGVAEGGTRLANEVREVVHSNPSLRSISLVGNSLGGLYARYAAKLLYREHDEAKSSENDSDDAGGESFSTSTKAMTRSLTEALDAAAREHESSGGRTPASKLSKVEVQQLTEATTSVGARSKETKDEQGGGSGVNGTVAGLRPAVFMSIAAPHLGVRRFTYIPVPSPLHGLVSVFVGKTGSDLFLNHRRTEPSQAEKTISPMKVLAATVAATAAVAKALVDTRQNSPKMIKDGVRESTNTGTLSGDADGNNSDRRDGPLLYRMATSDEFLIPLKAFQTRSAYANRRGDFMVPYETAAFIEPNEGDGAKDPSTESKPSAITDQVIGFQRGAIVGTSTVQPSSKNITKTMFDAVFGSDERKKGEENMEDEMAAGLNSCGWQKVSVDFGGLLPLSHNKICALSRTRVATVLWGAGKNIMDHAADFVVSRYSEVDADVNSDRTRGESDQ